MSPARFAASLSFVSALALASTPSQAANAGHLETASFADVRTVIESAVAVHGANRVLVVFDLDNTTLATNQDLGSEHWFLWQSDLIKNQRFGEGAVAKTVDDLLKIQGWIYTVTASHLVEKRISTDVRELAGAGVRFMALTSRGLDVRDVTLRELAANGLDLTEIAPGPHGGYGGAYYPYDLSAPEASGLTADDVTKFNLQAPKAVVFEHGVMLTQGQHKGIMLKTLLAKTGRSYDAVVYFDDRLHHSEGMQAAFEDRPEQVSTVRYIHELAHVEAFQASDKAEARRQWCALGGGLVEAFRGQGPELLLPCAATVSPAAGTP